MKNQATRLFFTLLSCMLCTHVLGANNVIVYTEQSYPLNYTQSGQDDAPVIGPATELVVAILQRAGLEFTLKIVPWTRAIQALEDSNENILVYSMARTEERETKYDWIGEILPLDYHLYGLKSNARTLPRTMAQAKGASIGVVRNDVVHRHLLDREFNKLVLAKNTEQNLRMLMRGRIEMLPYSSFGIGLFVKRHGFEAGALIGMVPLGEISNGMYLVASKNTNKEIVVQLRNAYREVKRSGSYDQIMNKLKLKFKAHRIELFNHEG